MAAAFIIIHLMFNTGIWINFIVQVINTTKCSMGERNKENGPEHILGHLHELTYIYNYIVK